jgi:hypothetical protein
VVTSVRRRILGLFSVLAIGAVACGAGVSNSDGGPSGSGGSAGSGGQATGGQGGNTGGVGGASGGHTGGGAGGAAGGMAGGGGGGGIACGSSSCTSGQLCVHPSCGGGAPPQCDPLVQDGGQCPSGWTYEAQCPPGSGTHPGCVPPLCTPPEPFCLDIPAGCAGTVGCPCLPSTVCNQSGTTSGGGCLGLSGANVRCGSA